MTAGAGTPSRFGAPADRAVRHGRPGGEGRGTGLAPASRAGRHPLGSRPAPGGVGPVAGAVSDRPGPSRPSNISTGTEDTPR